MRWRPVLVWTLWLAGLGLLGLGLVETDESLWAIVTLLTSGTSFGLVGLILAIKRGVAMGWLFLTMQAIAGLDLAGLSGNEPLILVAGILLIFPDRSFASVKPRWTLWALGAAVGLWLISLLGLAAGIYGAFLLFVALVGSVMAAGTIRIVNDYRRSVGETRQQLKWLAWVLVVGFSLLLISVFELPVIGEMHNLAGLVLFAGAPMAIGFSIMRYRLYDVDRIISRTVSYTLLVVFLGLIYAGLVALVGTRFTDSLAVAASTLTVAAVFNPVRSRLQMVVDRRFNRAKYDAERVMDEFAASLRDQLDPDGLIEGWLGAVAETMQPARVGVWMRS